MKNIKYKKIMLIIGFIIFTIMGFMVRNSSEGIFFDVSVLDYIQGLNNKTLFNIMKLISLIGSFNFLIPTLVIVIIYMLRKRTYYQVKILVANSLGSWILNFLIKALVNRTRPLDYFLVDQSGLSFPSGHSMVTMSLYMSIAYLISNRYPENKRTIYSISMILIFIMGFSRLYLGVHWPTDVIGGFIIGFIFYEAVTRLVKE